MNRQNSFKTLVFIGMSALTLASAQASEDDGEFMGYLRVGGGVNSAGGPQNCYYLGNGDGHGYRLGNECDSYAELGYAKTLAKATDDTRFVGHFMVNDYSSNSAYSGNVQIAQIYVEVEGLTWLNGGTAWAGERYYERPDIHWMDLQYINLNGTGGGFDNIDTPLGGKFSYAIFKDNDSDVFSDPGKPDNAITGSSNSAVRNNLLYRELPVNPGAHLDVILGLITPSTPSNDRHKGYYVSAFHKQQVLGGDNTLGVQYGVGPGTGRGGPTTFDPNNPANAFSASSGQQGADGICCNRMGQSGSTLLGSNDTRLRVFDAIWIQPTGPLSAAFDILFEKNQSPTYGGGSSYWYSAGFRPEYAFAKHFKVQGEIGMDHVTYPGANPESLIKYTIAPTISLGEGFFDRPELRLFVTRANWNSAAINTVNANNGEAGAIGAVTSNTSYGVQLEAWWGRNWW